MEKHNQLIAQATPFEIILMRASKKFDFNCDGGLSQFKQAIIGSNIDLEKLANFNEFNFWHDIYGIYKHFDYDKNQCVNHFLPRSARRQNEN